MLWYGHSRRVIGFLPAVEYLLVSPITTGFGQETVKILLQLGVSQRETGAYRDGRQPGADRIQSGGKILRAYGVSILVTVIGTLINVGLSALMAYPLSVKNLPGRNAMNFFVFFTMLFNGGIVPSYLLWSSLGVKDTMFAQLLPNFLVSAWNVMMIRTYFTTSIPDALYEAAEIDGATQFQIFRKIVIPLGKPILVTMGTFAGLTYWNDWTNGLYYITRNKDVYNIQNLLNTMISNIQYLASSSNSNVTSAAAAIPSTAIQMAIAFVAILPIMLIFPFFQKYYTKGLTLGGVKG